MELDASVLPLTRRQLDIWLAQETGDTGTDWQLGLFVRIGGAVDPDLLKQAISKALSEAEAARAVFFEVDGQVFQKVTEHPDFELACYDLRDSSDPEQQARAIASSMQHTPMPLTGKLLKFALFRTKHDEYYWFTCCHHIILDGLGIALVGRRIAAIYSAIVSGSSPSPPFSGRYTTWYTANWTTRRPRITWPTRLTGVAICRRHRPRTTRQARSGEIRLNRPRPFSWIRRWSAGSRSCPRR